MLLKSQFRVDIFQLNHTNDPDGLLKYMKRKGAQELGIKLCETIPFELNKEMSVRRELVGHDYFPLSSEEHRPHEQYDCEIFAVSRKDWEKFKFKMHAVMNYQIVDSDDRVTIRELFEKLEGK